MVQTGPSTAVARVPRLVLLAVLVVGTLLIAMVSECTAARVRQVGVGYRRSFVPAAGERKRRGDADPTFDPQFSSKMAVLSAVAYCPDDTITNWSCRACTSDPHLSGLRIEQPVKLFESRALELSPITAYVALMKEEDVGLGGTDPAVKALVVFRGTASIYDWVVNLDFYRKKAWDSCGDKCYVHSGFDDAWKELRRDIVPFLDNITQPYLRGNEGCGSQTSMEVIITGHSLGGAIATLAAAEMELVNASSRYNVSRVYTFGSPRVGNAKFATWYNNNTMSESYRVVHNKDIVPHLPFIDQGYHHTRYEVFYDERFDDGRRFVVCDGSGEDDGCSDQFSISELSITDHLRYMNITMGGSNMTVC